MAEETKEFKDIRVFIAIMKGDQIEAKISVEVETVRGAGPIVRQRGNRIA